MRTGKRMDAILYKGRCGMQIRLDKYLADMGIGTRSEVKQQVRKGQVRVNGAPVKDPGQKVAPGEDLVEYQGEAVVYAQKEYYMLYKPMGCVSAVSDRTHKTVMEYITCSRRKDLFPVGRLDMDTEGLLLITNDGALSHSLLAPGKHVEKTYYARVTGMVGQQEAECFLHGVEIGDETPTRPARLEILSQEEGEGGWVSEILLTLTEGRFHQVKRMFEAVGKRVLYLKRISMGTLKLDETLEPGEYRALTEEEVSQLMGAGQGKGKEKRNGEVYEENWNSYRQP